MRTPHDRIAALESARPQNLASVLELSDARFADVLRNAITEIESSQCLNDAQTLANFRGKLMELEGRHGQAH